MLISRDDRLSYEKSSEGRKGHSLGRIEFIDSKWQSHLPASFLREEPPLMPSLTEPETIRHFVNLSKKNFSIDTHFYPLGSCSMKYNPKINEWAASLEAFASAHPLQPQETIQGYLSVLYDLEQSLRKITGMDQFTLQPAAGAHGELTGMMIVKAHHKAKSEGHRNKVLVPDSSHGTNPASAALLGYEVVQIRSDKRGRVDVEDLKKHLGNDVACLMLTNPNTLGLFEENILEVAQLVHQCGGLLYYDGANLNALLGISKPGEMGFDIVHLNLHKTFSTPHGGGGPGAGPVGVKKHLIQYLPLPLIVQENGKISLTYEGKTSIGRVGSFYGNAAILLRAYVYILTLGADGLQEVSENAILNANYLMAKLKSLFPVAVDEACMHEFVLTLRAGKVNGIHAGDIGKRLLDYGFHAPTVHFPLIVDEAFMIEPTETESKETLDRFIEALVKIKKEIENCPEIIKTAPHTLPIKRPNEVQAARKPILTYRQYQEAQAAAAPVSHCQT